MSETIDTVAAVARINGVALHAPCREPSRRKRCASAPAPSCCARPRSARACSAPTTRPGPMARSAKPRPRRSTRCSSASCACRSRRTKRAAAITRRTPARYAAGERVRLRHILFAVTPGVDVVALRKRAEARCSTCAATTARPAIGFADAARALSNCPSGAEGGDLGWVDGEGLRAGVRARDLRQGRDRRPAAARAQPLRPARGRGAGPGAGRGPGIRGGARRGGGGAAPAGLRDRIAPVPAGARGRGDRRGRRPRRRGPAARPVAARRGTRDARRTAAASAPFHDDDFPGVADQFQNLVRDGQHPTILFIGCSDSRIVPYLLTGTGPGELFIIRNVGAFVPPYDAGQQPLTLFAGCSD